MPPENPLDALDRIAALVDSSASVEHAGPTMAATVRSLVRGDGAIVALRPPDRAHQVRRFALGIELPDAASGEVLLASDPLLGAIVADAGALVLEDYAGSDVRDPALLRQGVTRLAAAPIVLAGRVLGAIAAVRLGDAAAFSKDDAHALLLAGRHIALVAAAFEARGEHARAVRRERILSRAVSAGAAAGSLDEALAQTALGACAVSDAAFAAVLTAGPDGSRFDSSTPGPIRDLLARAAGVERLSAIELAPLEEAFDPALLALRRPVLIPDPVGFLQRLGLRLGPRAALLGRRAMAAMPILDGEALDGLLIVLVEGESPDPTVYGPLETLAAHAGGAIRRNRLATEVESAYLSTVSALANALEAKDGPTSAHATQTSELAVAVGHRLGLGEADLRDLRFAAVLHDVGKIAIPDEVLRKPGPLTDDEWDLMRRHTADGERILRDIPFLAHAAQVVRSAHERWDGRGYPDRLAGVDIPLLSRIVFACDTWDVMVSERPYRPALPFADALRRLRAAAGSQLDPQVVDALVEELCGAPALDVRAA